MPGGVSGAILLIGAGAEYHPGPAVNRLAARQTQVRHKIIHPRRHTVVHEQVLQRRRGGDSDNPGYGESGQQFNQCEGGLL